MMEENERGRDRGLPIDALDGRLGALERRDVLRLDASERERLLALAADLSRDGATGDDITSTLVGWFTRREVRGGFDPAFAVRRAEAFVEYLVDVSAEGEARAYERLAQTLEAHGGVPEHAT